MAIRTTPKELAEIVDTDDELTLAPFIKMSANLIDYCESEDSGSILTASHLVDLELLLAAHFYSLRDQQLEQEKTGEASGKYRGTSGMGLEATTYGQNAIASDLTGCLARLNQQMKEGKKTATVMWLGKARSDQIDYEDRD